MPRPIHFEIQADNPARAIAFYEKTLGWLFKKWDGGPTPYWLVTTGADGTLGINGGMDPRAAARPTDGQAVTWYVCTVGVDNIDACAAKITAAGGSISVPKVAIPGVGWLVYARDTEGNIFGMMQNDREAQ